MEFEKLQDIIADVLNVSKDDIHPETTFVDDLGAASLLIFHPFHIKSVRSHTGHSDTLIFSSISFSTASLRLSSAHTPLLLTHSRSSAYARFRMPPS